MVAYTPVVRTFTVDMTKLSAAAYTRWFDPSDGSYLSVAEFAASQYGHPEFRSARSQPRRRWWLGALVLETQPPETVAPSSW